MLVPGKQFEFDTLYQDNHVGHAQNFGPVKLYQIGELSCINGYEVPPHKQWCHEISYVISGEGVFTTNDHTNLLVEGDVHFSPAGSIHAIKTNNNADLRYAYIGFSFDENIRRPEIEELEAFYTTTQVFKASNRDEMLVPIFRNLDELYNKTNYYPLMVETYLIQTLVMVYRAFAEQNKPKSHYFPVVEADSVGHAVYAVIKYIDRHIFEKLEVRQIAQDVGYNYSYISNMFKKATGITLQRYINNKKIEKSIELLRLSKLTITQVAKRLEYANVQSFNKAFRRTMGVSPSEFVRAHPATDQPQGNGALPVMNEPDAAADPIHVQTAPDHPIGNHSGSHAHPSNA